MVSKETAAELVEHATQAREKAYARYSNYPVGAALLTKEGQIFTGVNVENSVYPLTVCAERAALFTAVTEGYRSFEAIAVVTRDAGTPCGSCRQVLAEFGLDIEVIIADTKGEIQQITSVAELLPFSFGPDNLDSSDWDAG
ncbi:MAG: cytidine deaminase [Anaerolineales bacterium]|nr:cytidine deaminase [Anaerolineales bacterium]